VADFCQQCSLDMFGEDMRDLAGLGTNPHAVIRPGQGYFVICEGCGPTIVDEDGQCIASACGQHGHLVVVEKERVERV
jgi:hypothetical protein